MESPPRPAPLTPLAPAPLAHAATSDPEEQVALVLRARAGDRAAFSALYHRYVADVYRFALARLGNREAAEDATQAIFLRALAVMPSCREPAAFVGWLFAIARSVVTDQLRARRFQTDAIPEEPEWMDTGPSLEEEVVRREARQFLLEARARCLSDRERELFDLLLTELNDKQIAEALGRSHGALRTAHSRLIAKLRACMGSLRNEPTMGGAHA
jgi:RNA polymerase sigma-70 factor (ECF subfamily)